MLERRNFGELRKNILTLQNIFKQNGDIIINTRHIDEDENSIIYNGNESGSLDEELSVLADYIVEKETPNIFSM